ncbi:AI-2E family transporter [Kineosporia sp. J2-2]|uniref:AI-2E family transporter n=1 Tax=Kineosporia corallincola TaxID=2835133 RepID=A0ABS5THC0_9ACTN|nr:AI-2E family transporter [Kineosporia corallincola]MBT0770494.1 AI-2E family transporter [Kineosporia corallincola]
MSIEQDDPTRVRPAELPHGLRVSAAWAWRVLLIAGTVWLLWRIFSQYQVIFVPLLVALMLSALLKPLHRGLSRGENRAGLPNAAAALLTVFLTIVFVAGLMTLIGQQAVTGFDDLRDDAADGITELQAQLARGPLNVTSDQLDEYVTSIQDSIRGNGGSEIVSGALEVTNTAGHVLTGIFIVLFSTYFFLSGGDRMWEWVVGLFPAPTRDKVRGSGVRAWATLTAYVRATVIVAIVDGVGVGVGAAFLGVPLAFPLGMVVFIGAFVPIVGALVSGAAAVLVALVAGGFWDAVIMLGIVIAVQQLEAHVLQPFLLGRAVRVHPLAVIIAISAGVLLAGIVGALFAVPFVAVANVIGEYLAGRDPEGRHEQPSEEQVGPLADESRDDEATDDATDDRSTWDDTDEDDPHVVTAPGRPDA